MLLTASLTLRIRPDKLSQVEIILATVPFIFPTGFRTPAFLKLTFHKIAPVATFQSKDFYLYIQKNEAGT
ncbi:hypothetical protein ACQKII_18725 [Lysinibacillus sp. NPDC048646]|uniref:hypothetical protein n=1 Tax=Lysinibacillus sp. NPDC048646 TaxID=3390574 RepID=UPI003D028C72